MQQTLQFLLRWRVAITLASMVMFFLLGLAFREDIQVGLVDLLDRPALGMTLIIIVSFWFFVSQLVVIPSGSMTLLITGAAIGWWSGFIFYVAMIGAGLIVFTTARLHPEQAMQYVSRWATRLPAGWAGSSLVLHIQGHTVTATAAFRLLPVMPSAAAAMLIGAAGGDRQGFLLATALTGWIRPIAFGVVGQSAGAVWRDPARLTSATAEPILLVASGSLLLSGVIYGYWLWRQQKK